MKMNFRKMILDVLRAGRLIEARLKRLAVGVLVASSLATSIAHALENKRKPAQTTNGSATTPVLTCDLTAPVAVRLKALNAYVEAIGAAIDDDRKKLEMQEWLDRADVFAPNLLPKDSKFRNFSIQCWSGFEESRKNLETMISNKESQSSSDRERARKSLEYWESCLKDKPPEAQKLGEQALPCMRIQNDTGGSDVGE